MPNTPSGKALESYPGQYTMRERFNRFLESVIGCAIMAVILVPATMIIFIGRLCMIVCDYRDKIAPARAERKKRDIIFL